MSYSQSFVLASNSPRRRELLSLTGWDFISSPANIDESHQLEELPDVYVIRLAREKATACGDDGGRLILAADTIVVDGNELLGKPAGADDARQMLLNLRGHAHQVMTAVALLDRTVGKMETEICITDVPMRKYTNEEIDRYIQSGDPFDKAGAYAIQHQGFHPVHNFNGCFASVMGLPLCHVKRMASRFGVAVSGELVANCQKINQYSCPIHHRVEKGEDIG
jgi:septum formation protein